MNTKADCKINILVETLSKIFGNDLNLARIKLISLFISALCKVQTVNYDKLAAAFDSNVKVNSSLRRIQRFMSDYILDPCIIAKLVFALLPDKPPYRLAMDRTTWEFGTLEINVLVIAIVYKGVAFPLLFSMMPNCGNSTTKERIKLMQKYIGLFGIESIDCLVADREFIGDKWLEYLNFNRIRYHIRARENFRVTIPKNGHRVKASWIFNNLKLNTFRFYNSIVLINKQLCYISGSKVKNKNGKPELQIIISFNKPDLALSIYKERWQIETAFRALKTSGFNIEDTHLNDMERIAKLFSLVLIAFVWAYKVGIFLDSLTPIKIKKHGRKAKSYFKHGLSEISNALFLNDIERIRTYCLFLLST